MSHGILRRVVCVVGPWQLITAAAAIRQQSRFLRETPEDYLVLYGFGLSESARRTMMRIASFICDWRRIEWAGDILEPPDMPYGECSPQASRDLQDRIGTSNADELWVCKLNATPERVAMEAFRRARVVFYEDGLGSYQSNASLHGLIRHPRLLARYLRWLVSPPGRGACPVLRIPRHRLQRLAASTFCRLACPFHGTSGGLSLSRRNVRQSCRLSTPS